MDSEEEALFRSSPYPAIYYVHSPSTVSHANSADFRMSSETFHTNNHPIPAKDYSLSRYSSSRGSTSSFSNGKKMVPYGTKGDQHQDTNADHDHDDEITSNTMMQMDIADQDRSKGGFQSFHDVYYKDYGTGDDDEDEEEDYFERNKVDGWRRLLSYSYSSSPWWKFMQISWRFVVSVAIALLVFYLMTKPPPPNLSIQVSRVGQFELAEGVDETGVSTKMLTCNCSVEATIDNKSKLFALHIHPPPSLAMSFANLPFAVAQGPDVLKVGADRVETVTLHVGTRKKPMYGAGRSMQDLLESNNGLPLSVHIKFRTSFHVVWGLISSKFHHQAHCFILVAKVYDKKHRTQRFISRCTLSS